MKAKILNDGEKIFYRKKRRQPLKSLTLDDSIGRIFTGENDPVKLNLKAIHELRNHAIHLVIPFVPPDIMGLFQAGVINYPNHLQKWFDINLSDRVPLGMMTIIYDFDPKQHSLEHAKMKRKIPASTIHFLNLFQHNIREQSASLAEVSYAYCIPITLRLTLNRNPDTADITVSSGISGREAIVIESPRNYDKTHPYRQTELKDEVNKRLQSGLHVSAFDIQCIRKAFKVDNKVEFFHRPKYSSPQYSDAFCSWIVTQIGKNPTFLADARQKAKQKI